ncbi:MULTISPECIES: hypothetical protein [Nostoc]|uniref:Uncharacterized protein n=1 Tax=Nostoc paludosum FACHB-159 TaxID=2692908 RepID=A0ABR8KHG9_9NOSO|nr:MULTISPECIES: hypothetical protein [Nostoc]MBD2681944.1 hypothetical protein [Nostoc sp. FACHB-857]MBD2738314.1 hypothetical protein [Nostoc paludosum FACHB-159]
MESKLVIRQFYEEKIKNNYEDNICRIFQVKFEIGSASFTPQDTFKNENINIQEFAKACLKEEVPTGVLSAFKRHIWYAKHAASYICIFKIPANKDITYAICINGYVDDGWDNSGNFIEVYDEQGELMGAKILSIDDEDWENWIWMDRPLQSKDFNSFIPPWSQE